MGFLKEEIRKVYEKSFYKGKKKFVCNLYLNNMEFFFDFLKVFMEWYFF